MKRLLISYDSNDFFSSKTYLFSVILFLLSLSILVSLVFLVLVLKKNKEIIFN